MQLYLSSVGTVSIALGLPILGLTIGEVYPLRSSCTQITMGVKMWIRGCFLNPALGVLKPPQKVETVIFYRGTYVIWECSRCILANLPAVLVPLSKFRIFRLNPGKRFILGVYFDMLTLLLIKECIFGDSL